MRTIAIIPAGGRGIRSGFSAPKQYLKINNKELIVHTLQIFQTNNLVDQIIISANPSYFSLLKELKKKYELTKIIKIVEGGKERQDSVYNGIKSVVAEKDDLIIVHDAARPFLSQKVLTGAINLAGEKGSALVCVKARDTLINGGSQVHSYIDRDNVYYVQTPQIFSYGEIKYSFDKAFKENFRGTDESMIVKNAGFDVNIVEGSLMNFKVTTKDDIELAAKLLK